MFAFEGIRTELPEHPFYGQRLEKLAECSAPAEIQKFVELLPRTEHFFDLRFYHKALLHVVEHVREHGETLSRDSWLLLCRLAAPSCLPLSAIETILIHARRWLRDDESIAFLDRASRRFAFQQQLVADGLATAPPITLGVECLTWTIPGRWGFRTGANGIRTFTPLAAAHHHPNAVIGLLREGIENYAPTGSLRSIISANGLRLIGRTDGRVLWNHHIGAHWQEDNFAFFRLRTNELMENFWRLLYSPPFPTGNFVFQHRTDDIDNFHNVIDDVYRALLDLMKISFRLIVINDAWRIPNQVVLEPPDSKRAGLQVIYAPPPFQGYVWHDPRYWDTETGLRYELEVAMALRKAMSGTVTSDSM